MIQQRKTKSNVLFLLGLEKSLIERHYSFIKCKIENGILYCYGIFQPTEISLRYEYRIKYNGISKPDVHVRKPKIDYNDEIHMYPIDNSLCLYHSTDLVWSSKSHLFDTIIPWTHEWFVFYEIYQITGKWEHPFVPHIDGEKNVN